MRRMAEILDSLLRSDPRFGKLEKFRITAVWREVVGEKIASKAKLVDFENGILLVECDDPLWANELNFMKGAIISKMNERMGKSAVRDMSVRRGWGWRNTPRRT